MSDVPDEPGEETAAPEAAPPAKKVKAPKPPKPKKEKGKGFNWVLVLIPVALVAALVLAYALPPTHAMLVNSPLRPLLARFEHSAKGTGATSKKVADPQADAKRLSDTVESDRKAAAAKDAQIAQLQSQVTELQAKPTAAPSGTPAGKATPAAVSDEVKRAAMVWAGMDADKAADIVKQLPDAYVKGVFSQMPADAVADIMSALPAKTAARLTSDETGSGSDPKAANR